MSQKILPRFTLPNQRRLKSQCDICSAKFQLLVKQEHQCKRCLRAVCQQCGPERRTVYEGDGSSSLHRCCLVCIKQIDLLNDYKDNHQLEFGQDSEYVMDWVGKLNKDKKSYNQILNEFSESITGQTNKNTIRFKSQSDIIFKELLESFNYSFRHFYKIMTEKVNSSIVETKVFNVMLAIFARVKTLPYIPQLIYLTVFFLCFANEAHTYFIITRIIEKIHPQYIRANKMKRDNLLSSSLKSVLEMYKVCVERVDRNELETVAQYLQNRLPTYVLTFTLNISSMPVSFFILNKMLNIGSNQPFYKGIASMISFCREQLAAYKKFQEVQVAILRNVSVQKLEESFIKFQKSDAKFEISNQVFDSTQHRKLHDKFKQMQVLYAKSEKSLAEKQAKIKQILADLAEKKKIIEKQTQKQQKLQIDLLKLSNLVPKLLKFDQVSSKYQEIKQRNTTLQQKCTQLQQKISQLEKQRLSDERYKKGWAKMQTDFINQIVDLRTKLEIMEVKVLAKEIDFNTSFIDLKFSQKNEEIKLLNEEVKKLREELEYYKLKSYEKSFSPREKKHPLKNGDKNHEEMDKQSFQKYIQNSKSLLEGLNQQVSELKQALTEKQAKIKELQDKNISLEQRLKETQEISKIIKQIPEEYNYVEAIEQLERLMEKENFMKKKILQSIKDSFERCRRELRFRTIDCRIKGQRIKVSEPIRTFSMMSTAIMHKSDQSNNEDRDTFLEVLRQIDNNRADQSPNKPCLIM